MENCCTHNQENIAMPQVTFSTFILSLASSALMQLGEIPNPETGTTELQLDLARHTIDVLEMLHNKTHGCLTEEEKSLLSDILHEVKMKYVVKTK